MVRRIDEILYLRQFLFGDHFKDSQNLILMIMHC